MNDMLPFIGLRGNTNPVFQVKQLIFAETNEYQTPTIRPYNTHLNNQTMLALQEATNYGNNLEKETLASIASQIVSPSTTPQREVRIANGFSQKRLRFLMSIELINNFGQSMIYFISGYTDFPGVSNNYGNAVVDEKMRLFFNSVIKVRKTTVTTPVYGPMEMQTISQASHILTGSYAPSLSNMSNVQCTIRPKDIFENIGVRDMFMDVENVMDARNTFATGPVISRRSNNSPSTYLSDILKNGVASIAEQEEDDPRSVMDRAAGMCSEHILRADPVLQSFLINSDIFSENGSITFRELKNLDPNVDNVTIVTLPNSKILNSRISGRQYEHFNGSNYETIIVSSLQHSIPAIMIECMIVKICITVTNMTLDGSWFITIIDAKTFASQEQLQGLCFRFKEKIENQILKSISNDNQIAINLTLDMDLNGDSSIKIGYNGGIETPFLIPTFADGLFSPVVSDNKDVVNQIGHDVYSILNNLNVSLNDSSKGYKHGSSNEFRNFNHGI